MRVFVKREDVHKAYVALNSGTWAPGGYVFDGEPLDPLKSEFDDGKAHRIDSETLSSICTDPARALKEMLALHDKIVGAQSKIRQIEFDNALLRKKVDRLVPGSDELYMDTQTSIIEIGKLAATLDLDSFLKAIRNAQATTPLLDPTMYRKAAANLEAIKELSEAVREVKIAHEKVFKAVLNTAVLGFMEKKTNQ